MSKSRNRTILSLLGITSLGLLGKMIYDYKTEDPDYSKETWLLQRLFSFFTWPVKKVESEKLYTHFIQLLRRTSDETIDIPDIEEVDVSEVWMNNMQNILLNNKKDPEQNIVFFLHGGAYLAPPAPQHFNTAVEMAEETDALIFMPIYPKAPNYDYTDAYPKLLDTYKSMLEQTSSPKNVVFFGDSAGGGLAVGLSSLLADENLTQPKRIILSSPWLDASSENPNMKKNEKNDTILPAQAYFKATGRLWADGEKNVYDPLVSPLYSDNLSSLPPTYIVAGDSEMLYPDMVRFKEKVENVGKDIDLFVKKDMVHDYAIFDTPEGREARELIIHLINK